MSHRPSLIPTLAASRMKIGRGPPRALPVQPFARKMLTATTPPSRTERRGHEYYNPVQTRMARARPNLLRPDRRGGWRESGELIKYLKPVRAWRVSLERRRS